jgi:hypothetical protein
VNAASADGNAGVADAVADAAKPDNADDAAPDEAVGSGDSGVAPADDEARSEGAPVSGDSGVPPSDGSDDGELDGLIARAPEFESDSGFSLSNLDSETLRALEESDAIVVVKRKLRK